MDSNYHAHQTPQFRVLSDGQIERLYCAALECLDRTGVRVLNAEARGLLAAAGARIDGSLVRIPASIIQDAVSAAPRSFTLWGRDGVHKMQLASGRVYFGPGPTANYFLDPETGVRRQARRGDPGLTALVCDALDNIDYVMGLGLIADVTGRLAPVYEFAEMIANTGKPVLPWTTGPDQTEDIYRIAVAVAGGEREFRERPNFALFTSSMAPLIHPDEDLASMLWAAEHGVPVVYLGAGTAGSTAPVTGAGVLVVILAEALSGLAIIQLKRRGASICIGGVPMPMDLRSARPSYGSPELALYNAALGDICRYLGLPMMGTGGASEAKAVDLQAAVEGAMTLFLAGLSGTTLVHDVGFLDCADIGSLEMLVMSDEIMAMARRVMRGIEVSDETLMLDLIDQVGPSGEFMSTRETAKLCRTELWNPRLADRQPWQRWDLAGRESMGERAKSRLHAILGEHRPAPLPVGAADQIAAILEQAEVREAARTAA